VSGPGSHDFRTVGSETVYSGAILSLRLDDVEMPGGRTARREAVRWPSSHVTSRGGLL
jgi:hypothetical protein